MWTAIFNYILYNSCWKHISQNGSYVQQNTIFNLFFIAIKMTSSLMMCKQGLAKYFNIFLSKWLKEFVPPLLISQQSCSTCFHSEWMTFFFISMLLFRELTTIMHSHIKNKRFSQNSCAILWKIQLSLSASKEIRMVCINLIIKCTWVIHDK